MYSTTYLCHLGGPLSQDTVELSARTQPALANWFFLPRSTSELEIKIEGGNFGQQIFYSKDCWFHTIAHTETISLPPSIFNFHP